MPTTLPSGAPGIYIQEQLSGPIPAPLSTTPSVAGFAGEHWRGPTPTPVWSGTAWVIPAGAITPAVPCTGWNQFVQYYGGFNPNAVPVLGNPYLAYSVYEYFANGGVTAYISRITAAATGGMSASVALKDSAATPQNTLSLIVGQLGVAGSVGTWGNNLSVLVTANTSGPGRFNLGIYYAGVLVENWIDLSMTLTDQRYVVAILNSPISGSQWVVAGNFGDATAAPNNAPTASLTAFPLTGGIDSADPALSDRIAAMTVGTSPFDQVPGVLNMNMPGETAQTVIAAAIVYAGAAGRPFSFLVVDPPSGQTPAGVVSYIDEFAAEVSTYAAFYYPWIVANNPASSNLQSTILLPPGGFVLGQMVATDSASGVWTAPAGMSTALTNAVSSERQFTPLDEGTLNSNNVNAIRSFPNGSISIWGVRTMQQGFATLYVPIRRTLNYIEAALQAILQPFVFQPNDSLLWGNITAACNAFLSGLYAQNAFAGTSSNSSYYMTCDSSNNTQSTIQAGVTNAVVGVALVYPAEFINLIIAQFQSNGTTTVTAA